MKQIACMLLGIILACTGCLGVQHVDTQALPPPAPVEPPPPPPVLPGQTTETNAPQVLQALTEELDRASADTPAPPAPAPPPPGH
jgi:hypothetical protein